MVEGLQCAGYETDIKQCKSKTWLSNTCDHSKDVSVDCRGKNKETPECHYSLQLKVQCKF